MAALRTTIAALACTLASTAALLAAEEWKTITLGGDPDFTIEVPAAAKLEPQSKDSDEFMFLQAQAGRNGFLWCLARRFDYPKGGSQSVYAKTLATPRREVFCSHDGVKDAEVLTSVSFDHNGLQAATCAASYTDAKDKKRPGHVQSQMIIAAPSGMYQLTCTVEDEDVEGAQMAWEYFWHDYIARMQKSFHLPAKAR